MKTNTIVFTAPYTVEILENDTRQLNDDEVLVKLVRSTISAGTERANLVGDANTNSTIGPSVNFPRYGGYSCSGIIVEKGAQVSEFNVGDKVACSWTIHSQYVVVNKKNLSLLPQNVDFDQSAIAHIATFPLAAVRKCNTEIGESAIVMGLGILGLISVQLLRACGAVPIIAVDPVESKRTQALALGADYALNPFDADFAEQVKKLTNGGASVGIEVTGVGAGLNGILDCMRPHGRVALLGCTRNSDFTIDYYRKVHGKGVTMIGAHTQARPSVNSSHGWWTEKDDRETILNLISANRLNLGVLIEKVYSPNDAKQVYDELAHNSSFPVVQFDWTNM